MLSSINPYIPNYGIVNLAMKVSESQHETVPIRFIANHEFG